MPRFAVEAGPSVRPGGGRRLARRWSHGGPGRHAGPNRPSKPRVAEDGPGRRCVRRQRVCLSRHLPEPSASIDLQVLLGSALSPSPVDHNREHLRHPEASGDPVLQHRAKPEPGAGCLAHVPWRAHGGAIRIRRIRRPGRQAGEPAVHGRPAAASCIPVPFTRIQSNTDSGAGHGGGIGRPKRTETDGPGHRAGGRDLLRAAAGGRAVRLAGDEGRHGNQEKRRAGASCRAWPNRRPTAAPTLIGGAPRSRRLRSLSADLLGCGHREQPTVDVG